MFPDSTTGETEPRELNIDDNSDGRHICIRMVPFKIAYLKIVGMEIPYGT